MKVSNILNSGKLLFIGALAFSLVTPTGVFAAGTGDSTKPTVDIPTIKQQQAAAQKQKLLDQHVKERALRELSEITPLADLETRTISVPSYKQETVYWCGPATTKQVLGAINGTSETQTYYAKKLGTTVDGTDFSLVDNVLNDHQTRVNYTYREVPEADYEVWKSIVILTIDWGYPAVLDLKITPENMPLYKAPVAGHILNTSGYDLVNPNNKRIRLTDPFDQGNRGVTLGNVWHKFDGVWRANQDHFRKAIIW